LFVQRAQRPHRVVSLERAVSKLGIASRVEARALVAAGRVRVGGAVVRDPGRRVDPARDRIRIDGRPARAAPAAYWMLHKPIGCVTTRRDTRGRPTVYDVLPRNLPFLAPVGRLDLESSGLLLFTNDTQLAARLTDPRAHVAKVYAVTLDAPITAAAAHRLAAGVELDGRPTLPAAVELVGGDPASRLRITLVEGRNRQVRRMLAGVGRTVVALHRERIGPLALGRLAAGEARALRAPEIAALRTAAGAPRRRV
jgi:23S rRNA pseudouridine2605 synthase